MSLTEHLFPTVTLHRAPLLVSGQVLAAVALPSLTPDDAASLSWAASSLHPEERDLAGTMSPFSRATFVAGRVALRAAIAVHDPGLVDTPILRTSRGAPALPSGIAASVSHTRHVAVALSNSGLDRGVALGVDVEELPATDDSTRPDIGRRILTPLERERLSGLEPLAYRRATVVRFALKEAVYKAIDPIVQRYVGFTEVEVDVADTGHAGVTLLLPELAGGMVIVRASWWTQGGHIIATAVSERA